MIKEKIQKFGFYNDVLLADAMTMGVSKHRQLFQKASAHTMAELAGAAFGLEQVVCPQFSNYLSGLCVLMLNVLTLL